MIRRAPHRYRVARRPMGALPLLLIVLNAQSVQAPSVLLFGASLTAARDFAVAVAQDRGWRVLEVGPAGATFEQTLEGTDADSGPTSTKAIRVYASFGEEPNGVRVSLHAEEWDALGTGDEWMTDVTGAYGENLSHALSSLRSKWDVRAFGLPANGPKGDGGRVPDLIGTAVPAQPAPNPTASDYRPVGTWAYYAEAYAQDQGCELGDTGAVLEQAGPDWEQHRVDCRNKGAIRVRCTHGDCTRAP